MPLLDAIILQSTAMGCDAALGQLKELLSSLTTGARGLFEVFQESIVKDASRA